MGISIQARIPTPPLHQALPRPQPKASSFRITPRHRRSTPTLRQNRRQRRIRLFNQTLPTRYGDADATVRRFLREKHED